ncbi:hypothetical protein HX021_07905 [Sphingobacterium sp. N143]|uniref:hypothetical protein n=1 Tax=Sphingobacterium sp. N143 TaxID=2746727 RepID=UPI00257762AE|nr:hypothetical protein [Sphingobacterium sp. N143]MDM1294221.1 hypothetical protein [Sphingobacterium sp. N143]
MELFIKQIISCQLPKIIAMELQREDWRYKLSELKDKALFDQLSLLKRQELLSWLQWNDHTGIYSDYDRIRKGVPLFTKTQALISVYYSIMRNHEDWDGCMEGEYIRGNVFY